MTMTRVLARQRGAEDTTVRDRAAVARAGGAGATADDGADGGGGSDDAGSEAGAAGARGDGHSAEGGCPPEAAPAAIVAGAPHAPLAAAPVPVQAPPAAGAGAAAAAAPGAAAGAAAPGGKAGGAAGAPPAAGPATAPPRRPYGPTKWEPDEAAPACRTCRQPFTAFRRRHHCRACGLAFCDDCTSHRVAMPQLSASGAAATEVRVCVDWCGWRAFHTCSHRACHGRVLQRAARDHRSVGRRDARRHSHCERSQPRGCAGFAGRDAGWRGTHGAHRGTPAGAHVLATDGRATGAPWRADCATRSTVAAPFTGRDGQPHARYFCVAGRVRGVCSGAGGRAPGGGGSPRWCVGVPQVGAAAQTAPPIIARATPISTDGGQVILYGSNFGEAPGDITAVFNGAPAEVLYLEVCARGRWRRRTRARTDWRVSTRIFAQDHRSLEVFLPPGFGDATRNSLVVVRAARLALAGRQPEPRWRRA